MKHINKHCIQQNNQFLLNKTAVFTKVGSENSDKKSEMINVHSCLQTVLHQQPHMRRLFRHSLRYQLRPVQLVPLPFHSNPAS